MKSPFSNYNVSQIQSLKTYSVVKAKVKQAVKVENVISMKKKLVMSKTNIYTL